MKSLVSKTSPLHLFYTLPLIFLLVLVISQCLAPTRVVLVGSAHRLGNETDHSALLAIKSQLLDHPGGVLSSWNHSLHHCQWDGVTCGRKHNRVVVLDLNSRGLGGTISPYVGNLSFLINLKLFNNSLVGHIPPEIGRLYRLRKLGIYNVSLDGEIPANLSGCINLQRLSLTGTKFTGRLPLELRALSNLRILEIEHNNLTGDLFEVIANLTSLEEINADDNAFTGTIPISIGKMRNLQSLSVGENQLSGIIPASLFNCSALQFLDLPYINLQGVFPPDLNLKLPQLVYLNMPGNQMSGAFPSSVLNLTNLEVLALDYNDFTVGRVPHDFGHLQQLWFLSLSENNLKGDINFIGTLVNSTKLEMLQLAGNDFEGTLPQSIANLSSSLRTLNFRTNGITGEIPKGITNLISLQILYLHENGLTGIIPRDFGNFHNLTSFVLSHNSLTGSIPNSFGNLSRLSDFVLQDNQLQGRVPPSLGNCNSLLALDLSSNHLNATLDDTLFNGSAKFIVVDLSDNLLEGSIPMAISKQLNLIRFSVSSNKLSGIIPPGLGDCVSLQKLDIHGNFIQGGTPTSFSKLSGLQIVDFSRNNLSGSIPNYFSKFPLILLNLSYNNFEGIIPTTGAFSNASAIVLDGNNNLCGGNPELHFKGCVQRRERKTRKMTPQIIIIAVICAVVGVLITAIWWYFTCHTKKRGLTSTGSIRQTFMKVSYDMLLKATNGFSTENQVGVGSFGSVFRGSLNGITLAVKVLNLNYQGASKSFMAECNTLRNVRHRNLVGILTACSSIDFQRNDFKALVYEFMPNGSLDRWLHGDGEEKLTLVQRLDIAIDVAQALNYLHHDCEVPVVHCDLKPSNILLDADMVAHIGDFGLAKLLTQPRHPNQSSSIGIMGTVGYVAPEYGLGAFSSQEGDLYSYGILVLELMTGKRPTDDIFQEGYNLQIYAGDALPDNVLQIVDPTMDENETSEEDDNIRTVQAIAQRGEECMVSVISVGIECSKHLPQDRIKISDAICKLQVARDHLHDARHRRAFPRGTF